MNKPKCNGRTTYYALRAIGDKKIDPWHPYYGSRDVADVECKRLNNNQKLHGYVEFQTVRVEVTPV